MSKANFRIIPVVIAGSNIYKVERKMSFFGIFSYWAFEAFADHEVQALNMIKHLSTPIVKG